MQRWDWLRASLLAGLSGCAVDVGADGGEDGHTTTTMGTGTSTGETGETGETGIDEVCEFGCEGARLIADGIVECPDGRINLIGGGSYNPTITAPSCMGTETNLACTTDAECGPGPYAKCISGESTDDFGDTITYCRCASSCASDADCFAGSVCVPPFVVPGTRPYPTCVQVDCTSNADCGECGECGLASFNDGCSYDFTAHCRSDADTCATDMDCDPGWSCFTYGDAPWSCQNGGCAVGRPLLVDGRACLAAPRERDDWATHPDGLETLAPEPALAEHWAEIAALEHASVASFARFGAQLLSLAAPPSLVRACKQAALDEIEHARLAYALASIYAGTDVGPGSLALHGVQVRATWREIVEGLIVEACIGETLGVAEAKAAAALAQTPALRRVLERIADDELRHARLAWQCLDHLLARADARDRAWALALLERGVATVGVESRDDLDDRSPGEGVLSQAQRAAVHAEARVQVLEPLVQRLRRATPRTGTRAAQPA